MKRLIVAVLLLMCFEGYSQTSVKSQPNSAASLNQFMWGYSKNKPAAGEKALIDFDVMNNWRQIGYYLSVSDDGKYFAYTTRKPSGIRNWFRRQDSLIVQSTRNTWRQAFVCKTQGFFTADNKQYIFQDGSDLYFLQLGNTQQKVVKDIAAYKVSQNKWLAYQVNGKDSLIFQNLITGKEQFFAGITEYDFSPNAEWLVGKTGKKELLLYNLTTASEKRLPSVDAYSFSEDGKALLLKATDASLQYVSLPQADSKIIQAAAVIPAGLTISNASFTDNGRYIKLSLQAKAETPGKLTDDMVGVEVWNHKDLNLQSLQAKQVGNVKNYSAILNTENGKLVFLESDTKKISMLQGDFVLAKNDYSDLVGDLFWEKAIRGKEDSAWIVNLKDGSSNLVATGSNNQYWFSPSGYYLVSFNPNGCQYYSYDLRSAVSKNISSNLFKNQLGIFERYGGDVNAPGQSGIAAWIEKDGGLLVYDNYDIWKLDVTGKEPAVNVTNGFGKANTIMLSLMENYRYENKNLVLKANESLILQAYNTSNKQNGFYSKMLGTMGNPKLLSMGNYFINMIGGGQDLNLSNELEPRPSKAKNVNYWIVQRQSESEASNYFETADFTNFKRLTNVQPQKNYQWLSQELVSFKHLDGKIGQGILYKPENFDPAKKYPVLIAFYGAFSDNMYQFKAPGYIDQAMETGVSPIWFLNNGYLVFTPDIYVEPTKYGPKAFSVIEGAAQYLKQLPYVNGDKLGCVSHSWSAQLGAYIFTHSKSIGATAISEGFSYANMIDMAFQPVKGASNLDAVENERQAGNLWKNKESWLDQTTILNVDKSISPLLLFCNKESSANYQEQTFQFYTAMRRLNKNVWWLKYDNGSHTLQDLKELKDYTIRYTQFFDHYLKNAPAPLWMTQGVPYKLKGIESRYELDAQGTCNSVNGEPCPICQAWNAQYKRTPEMFQKEIKDWVLDKDITEELERKQKERRKELDKQGEVQTKEVMSMLNSK